MAGNIRINLNLPIDGLSGSVETVVIWNTTKQAEDAIAAAVVASNEQIAAQNAVLAAQVPPGTPLPLATPNGLTLSLLKPVLDAWTKTSRLTKKEANLAIIGDKLTDLTNAQLNRVKALIDTF